MAQRERGRPSRLAAVAGFLAAFALVSASGHAQPPGDLLRETARLAPAMLSRADWSAAPPLPGMRPHAPAGIVLHNTGTAQRADVPLATKVRALQAFSQREAPMGPGYVKPAWADIPYHYYIDKAGHIAEGRDPHFAGDSNTPYDLADKLQVVLEGNFDKEVPGAAQLGALARLVAWLQLAWRIPHERVTVHKDHADTTCPGANFMAKLDAVRAAVRGQHARLVARQCATAPRPAFRSAYCR